MEGVHQAELKRMAECIERLEGKLDRKNREIKELREELKNCEPMIQGFEELWCTENKKRPLQDKENTRPRKMKSVVNEL